MNLIDTLQSVRILVVGDVMLDRYYWGATERISPEAPVPVLHVQREESRLGGAANTAHNLAQLGVQVSLLGLIGADPTAEILRERLRAAGIEHTHLMVDPQRPTTLKLRMVARGQQLLRCDWEQSRALADPDQTRVLSKIPQLVDAVDGVIVSDYQKGLISAELIEALRSSCTQQRKRLLVDPKGADYAKYQGVSCITPNEKEALQATRTAPFEGDLEIVNTARTLLEEHQLEAVCITLGAKGVLALQRDQAPLRLAAQAREVYDVTGAGETFISVLGALWIAERPFTDAVIWANRAAGLVVAKPGTAVVDAQTLFAALPEVQQKIISAAEAAEQSRLLREQGKTVVFTNGCFDWLHAGHAYCLAEARKLGDVLMVGLNSDRSVQRLKGAQHPLIDAQGRAQLLAALSVVDQVVVFDADTPLELIRMISPHVLVKGGDYQPDEVVGADWVRSHGGRVKVIPRLAAWSSSTLVRKATQISAQDGL